MNYLKSEIRKEILTKRNKFTNRNIADKIIFDKLISVCSVFQKICIYINYGSEVNTINFINEMLTVGKEIFVPVCNIDECTMNISRIYSTEELIENNYGILEPLNLNSVNEKVDVVIFPGAAFDIDGNRIGYGKGYYDKYISKLTYQPYKIGICYDFQLLDEIPSDTHDIKLDKIITEHRTVFV